MKLLIVSYFMWNYVNLRIKLFQSYLNLSIVIHISFMGKVISFRLSEDGLKSLDNLKEHWGLDNRNQTLNKALNDVWEILRDKPALYHLKEVIRLLNV